ncbi:MAG TPA: hypothetical protein VF618_11130 [Thermoanaerobaculia bacterium]
MHTQKSKAVRIRPKSPSVPAGAGRQVAIFTAVDGTLLDAETFDPGVNRETIRRLSAAGIPVIPVSVMTLDELMPLAAELGLQRAMVIEAGSAIARWSGDGWNVEPSGPPAETLLDVVRDIEDRSGADLLVYSALPDSDAARVSGRTGAMLGASLRRRFNEPFLIESGNFDDVARAAATAGFSVRRGRRFLHLCRQCDEGEAFTRLRDELHAEISIAIGGSSVDAEFLSRADIAIIVPNRDGRPDEELLAKVPHAQVAPAPAPDGWTAAVEEVWRTLREAKTAGAPRIA